VAIVKWCSSCAQQHAVIVIMTWLYLTLPYLRGRQALTPA